MNNAPARSTSFGTCLGLAVAVVGVVSSLCVGSEAADPGFERSAREFLKTHCVACHGPDDQQANLRLDGLTGFNAERSRLWAMIHERVSDGEMPPKGEPRPDADETKRLLGWIEEAAEAHRAKAGTAGTRRLNRRELGAALRDVTGLEIDYAAALPGDGKLAGFDTGASALQDAADSVDRILLVTRRAVDGVRFLEPASEQTFVVDFKETKDVRKAFDPWKEQGVQAKLRGTGRLGEGLYCDPKWLRDRDAQQFYVPGPENGRGVVRFAVEVAGRTFFDDTPPPRLCVKVAGRTLEYREITGTLESPERLVYEVQVDDLPIGSKGVKIELSSRVELPYEIDGFENEDKTSKDADLPDGPGVYRPKYDRKKLRQPEEQPVPWVVLQTVEIEGDYVATWPPAEWEADVGEITDSTESADRLLSLWMERAWRRPVRSGEKKRFLDLYTRLRGDGFTFDEALRASFHSVLMSGPFRYMVSAADPDESIAQHAVASRLAFMLTGGPPDAELRELAAAGRLRDEKVLGDQVDRLLADPRSDAFFEPFVVQWLEMEQPITIAMQHISQQNFQFGRYLKESMRAETVEYVAECFRQNAKSRELVDGDWTMMNDSLGAFYGYEVEGSELRRVKLRKDDPRGGGFLGHAGIQSMLCWMGDNWVTYRGAWALRHVVDDPPPPPPLEVPELDPNDGSNQGKSFKEILAIHQEEPNCAVCHVKMDPLGFAFQNFDLSGRWRDVEHEKYSRSELDGKIQWNGRGETRPVDATGRMPRGEEFTDYASFKKLLVQKYQRDLIRGIMKNLVVYGAGRQPDVLDAVEIRATLDELEPKGFPLRDVLKAFVRSRAFLET